MALLAVPYKQKLVHEPNSALPQDFLQPSSRPVRQFFNSSITISTYDTKFEDTSHSDNIFESIYLPESASENERKIHTFLNSKFI